MMNPAEILRGIARAWARESGRQVDEDSFDRAAAYLNEPAKKGNTKNDYQ